MAKRIARTSRSEPDHPRPHRVKLIAFDAVEMLDVMGPLEAFATAESLKPGAYTVAIVAERTGPVLASSGLSLHATETYGSTGEADTLLIAGGIGVEAAAAQPSLREAVRLAARKVLRLGSICTGAFVLAAAGVLDGRRAVTHWKWCDRLAARHPSVAVERDAIFVVDGGVWTSAGVTAGIDMALAMIERDHGPGLALRTAQELVMFRRRPGGQSQFSVDLAVEGTGHRDLRRLQEWIIDHPSDDLTVEALAGRVAMSPRNFARAFLRHAGVTPARFVEQARLQHARALLETGAGTVAAVAAASGFRSADVLTRAMLRRLGVAPSDYRRRFAPIWSPSTMEVNDAHQ